ncbi:unnamed protein product, partial [Pylaiella littoralis]
GDGGAVSPAAIHAASTVGAGVVRGAAAYRRPKPPGAGNGSEKVRLEVCGEKDKTGAPDLDREKMFVFDRKEPFQNVLNTCREKLHIEAEAKGAALLGGGEEVVDWLSDLSWVPNGALVLISCTRSPPAQNPAAASVVDTTAGAGDEAEQQQQQQAEEDEEEALALAARDRIRESYRARAQKRQSGAAGRGGRSEEFDEKVGKRMMDERREVENTKRSRKIMAQRRMLPAYRQREDIVETIRNNQAVVLSGETGCGKTTQVPQFVLDSFIDRGKGGKCNIICTQPRRISAVGVAERVATERCEGVGGTVGYQIRLESRVGPSTRLTFCTAGILLRRLTSDDTLAGVSHVMVDEVHERDLNTDFLLVILRDLLLKRPDLRLVLMSATLQATYMEDVIRIVRGAKAPTVMPRVSTGAGVVGGRVKSRGNRGAQQANPSGRGPGGRAQAAAAATAPAPAAPAEVVDGDDNNAISVSPSCEDKLDYDIMVGLVDHIMKTESRVEK